MMQAHKPTPDAFPLDRLHLDDRAKGVLAIVRHFLTSFGDPETQSWQMAFATAAERWNDRDGPQTAMRILAVVQAMRRARPSPFRFGNPLCLTCRGWVTPEEADLMGLIQSMRRDRTDVARGHVAALTLGRIDPDLIRCALALAKTLGPVNTTEARARPQRPTHREAAMLH